MYKTVTRNLLFYCSLLVAFLIPLSHKITIYAIMLFVLSWLLSGQWFYTAKTAFKNSIFIILITFFLLHLAGLLYSSNMNAGWFDIEVKLTLILFPFMFFLSNSIDKNKREIILLFFLFGTVIAIIGCLINAILNFKTLQFEAFFYGALSVFHHPSYFAMYICFSSAIVIYWLLYCNKVLKKWYKIALFFLLIFLGVFIYFLSSKAGKITFFITLFVMSIPALFLKTKKILSILILCFAVFQIWFSLTQNLRFKAVISSVQNAEQNVNTEESNGVRVLVYETAINLIKTNYAIGVGTGDIKDVLMKEYERKEMKGAIEKKLNVHNQFLETWLGQGIAGITLLLLLFIVPFVNSIRTKNWLLMTFVIIIVLNFLTESMLNTQAGVVFFAFFYSFFVTNKNDTFLNLKLQSSNDK